MECMRSEKGSKIISLFHPAEREVTVVMLL